VSAPYDAVYERLREGKPSVVAYDLIPTKFGAASGTAIGAVNAVADAPVGRLASAARGSPEGTCASLNRRVLDFDDPLSIAALSQGPRILRDGETTVFAEPCAPRDRLIIFGAGHIAVPLAAIARSTEFDAVVVDDRPSFANPARFGETASVMCEYFAASFARLKVRESDYAVVVTRGHRHDLDCLRALLSGPEPRYVGMIGSRSRVALARERLIGEGIPADRIGRVHAPIGLPIGAVSPAEIAVSIAAELIAARRLGPGGERLAFSAGLDAAVIEDLARPDAGPRAAVTVVAAEGSVPRGAGSKLVAYPGGRIVGSVGGGCAESDAIKLALDAIGTGRWLLRDIDLSGPVAEGEGMVCGGALRVLIEDIQ